MKPDPPIPKDGTCAVCRKPRREVKPQKGVPPELYVDAFCSTECARAYHNNPIPKSPTTGSAVKGTASPRGMGFVHGTREGYWLCACEACRAAVKGPRAEA